MKKEIVEIPEKLFAGVTIETSNLEQQEKGTITHVIQYYFNTNIPAMLENRKSPGITLAIYTNYESNYQGNYLYGIGEEIVRKTSVEEALEHTLHKKISLTNPDIKNIRIPGGKYLKITTPTGPMMEVAMQTWQAIWKAEEDGTLGATRTYNVDFEIWGEGTKDPNNAYWDIYLGIQ
jgi:predicted transcriptional regulator YdeE